MRAEKLRAASAALGRTYHVDLFSVTEPELVVLFFGGSGISRAEYERRAESLHEDLRDAALALHGVHEHEACFGAGSDNGDARVFRQLPGGHRLADYLRNDSAAGLVRRAARLA